MGGLYILGIIASFAIGRITTRAILMLMHFNIYALSFIFSVILESLIWALLITIVNPTFREWRVVA